MPSQIGLVYYLDDPDRKVFRKVYPIEDDNELNDPKWVTLGCDSKRQAVLIKVNRDSEAAKSAFAGTP